MFEKHHLSTQTAGPTCIKEIKYILHRDREMNVQSLATENSFCLICMRFSLYSISKLLDCISMLLGKLRYFISEVWLNSFIAAVELKPHSSTYWRAAKIGL